MFSKIRAIRQSFSVFVLIILLCLTHLLFLTADPNPNLSFSRGPFTDEGLYTSQIRNYLNHGSFSAGESDAFIKTPLFSLYLLPFFQFFSTSQSVGRMAVLAFVIVTFFLLSLKTGYREYLWLVILTSFTNYAVFSFTHICISEIISTTLILLGCFLLFEYFKTNKNISLLVYSSLCISLSYYFKIQFIYSIVLLPAAIGLHEIFIERNKSISKIVYAIVVPTLFNLTFLALLIPLWYLPYSDIVKHVFTAQGGSRVEISLHSIIYFIRSVKIYLLDPRYFFLTLFFGISLLRGLYLFNKRQDNGPQWALFLVTLLWAVLEMHKLFMSYLPTRYMVSFFVAIGLFGSVVFVLNWKYSTVDSNRSREWRSVFVILLFLVSLSNVYNITRMFNDRTYFIREANTFLKNHYNSQGPVVGPWAPSLTWECKAVSLPAWRNYWNENDILSKYRPEIIISEPDEADSEGVFTYNNIKLTEQSSRIKKYTIGRWEVDMYWLDYDSF